MDCKICKVELEEEERPMKIYGWALQNVATTVYQPTGYLFCPECGLVYVKKDSEEVKG